MKSTSPRATPSRSASCWRDRVVERRRRRPLRRRRAGRRSAEAPPDETGGEIVDIVTPAGGESVTEGTILEWAVKVGDAVEDGETVVEISTDKVDMELPAPAAGTITEILAEEGETVTVGQVIARMQVGAGGASPRGAAPPGTAPPATARRAGRAARRARSVTPVAARVAAAEGVDLAQVTGTGPGGRITKADVLNGGGARRPAAAARSAPAAQGRRGDARPLHGRVPRRSRPRPRSAR